MIFKTLLFCICLTVCNYIINIDILGKESKDKKDDFDMDLGKSLKEFFE